MAQPPLHSTLPYFSNSTTTTVPAHSLPSALETGLGHYIARKAVVPTMEEEGRHAGLEPTCQLFFRGLLYTNGRTEREGERATGASPRM